MLQVFPSFIPPAKFTAHLLVCFLLNEEPPHGNHIHSISDNNKCSASRWEDYV
jgi:hypothetical protein